ncbi:MAG: hypothetical protein EBX69_10220, partial [Betaproteobacteria bacterium]|nr:hypothetical protein [Betaproteobacteria bacterium]
PSRGRPGSRLKRANMPLMAPSCPTSTVRACCSTMRRSVMVRPGRDAAGAPLRATRPAHSLGRLQLAAPRPPPCGRPRTFAAAFALAGALAGKPLASGC